MENSGGDVIVGLEYWLQWQVAVCALIILLPAVVLLRYLLNSNRTNSDQYLRCGELWIPCWRDFNPLWLLLFRSFAFASTAAILYQVVVELKGAFAFYFYTQWTFALVMIYFALATTLSARECWKHSNKPSLKDGENSHLLKKGSNNTTSYNAKEGKVAIKLESRYSQEEIERKAGFLGLLMQAIYQTCAGAVMLTDVIFWCLLLPFLLPEDFRINFIIWCTHGLNAIFLIIDSLLNSQPVHWHGFTYFVAWGVCYITFQWILHACCFTWWPYPFLELSTPWAPLWYFGMALVHVPCYGIYVLLIKAKGFIFSKMFPNAFVRSLNTSRMKSPERKQS